MDAAINAALQKFAQAQSLGQKHAVPRPRKHTSGPFITLPLLFGQAAS
jgi:hypothetical protein